MQTTIDNNGNIINIMPTTISEKSVELVSRLIRSKFDSIDTHREWYLLQDAKDLIQTARDYNLNDLANDMERDLM